MTIRRAPASGTRVRQMMAALSRGSGTAALFAGAFLFAIPALHASTRSHHSAPQSSGRVQAHVVHETAVRSTHTSGKASPNTSRHTEASDRPLAKSRRNAAPAKRGKQREEPRRDAKAHSERKHHEVVPIDDPVPMHRAANPRRDREARTLLAYREPTPQPHIALALPAKPVTIPEPEGVPGNVARNMARRAALAKGQPLTANSPSANGVSHPDEDVEELPAARNETAAPTQPRAIAPIVLAHPASGPTVAVIAAPLQLAQPARETVEGFGGEVDYRSSATRASALQPEAIAPPQGTKAEQARDLRDAAEAASQPMFVPLYNRDGKLVVPPPLKGSREILVHQNQMADDAGLTRIQDDSDLNRLRRAHLLVDLPETESLRVNEGLPENRRAARPWAVRFAEDIANAFYSRFGEPLQVNSAVRTVAYQLRLQRVNGNAASIRGDGASPHLTGQALDFGKRGMSVAQIAWMRTYLLPLIDAGKIDVEEEFQQACFHISIYNSYVPAHHAAPVRTEVAQTAHPAHSHTAAVLEDENMR